MHEGVIRVHAPLHTKVSMAILLDSETKAKDVMARFDCENGSVLSQPQPSCSTDIMNNIPPNTTDSITSRMYGLEYIIVYININMSRIIRHKIFYNIRHTIVYVIRLDPNQLQTPSKFPYSSIINIINIIPSSVIIAFTNVHILTIIGRLVFLSHGTRRSRACLFEVGGNIGT